jgi:F-actin capping protein, beta subunit
MATVQSLLEKAPPSDLERNWPWLRAPIPSSDSLDVVDQKYEHLAFSVADAALLHDGERPFLLCEYSQVVNQKYLHRSPWTNRIYASLNATDSSHHQNDTNAIVTNEELRRLEVTFNEVWDAYKNLYYGHESVGSVYLSDADLEENGAFSGWFGIHKKGTDLGSTWKSASMVRVNMTNDTEVQYTVETSVCVVLAPALDCTEDETTTTTAEVSAILSKKSTKSCVLQPEKVPLHVSHVEHIGMLIEANEIDLRSNLERVMIPKNPEILATLQKKQEIQRRPQVNPLMGMMMNSDLLKKRLAKAAAAETNESS